MAGLTSLPFVDPIRTQLEVAYWAIDRLVPYARNARTHSDAQVAEIAGSIRASASPTPFSLVPKAMSLRAMGALLPRVSWA